MERPRFEIVQEDMGGWVRVTLGRGEPTGELAKSCARTDGLDAKASSIWVRFVVPVSHNGDTVELHAWYDQVLFSDASPMGKQQSSDAEE